MQPIDFWFSIGSTYTYLTVIRLQSIETNEGVAFNWRPFDVRTIMIAQKNIPFANKPIKSAYMWRDIERRAAKYGLAISVPAPYPLEHLAFANQVALVGVHEGWCPAYVTETYRLWFQEGLPAGSEPNLSKSLTAIGQEPQRVIDLAHTPQTGAALIDETEAAEKAGIFGSPSFVVDGEVFWGDDRLGDALSWRKHGRVSS
jgi:2-hydroxychromene-2-carboxylate isomerase